MQDYLSLFRQRRYAECETACRGVLVARPSDKMAIQTLVMCLTQLRKFENAINEAEQARLRCDSGADRAMFLHLMASSYKMKGDQEEAKKHYRDAYAQDKARLDSLYMLAELEFQRNEFPEAMADLKLLLGSASSLPRVVLGSALSFLVRMDKDLRLNDVQAYLPDDLAGFPEPDFHFALGELYERTGNYEEAVRHFTLGNLQMRKRSKFDAAADIAALSLYREMFGETFFGELGTPDFATDQPAPVFIVGMPRTGSSLLEQMLGAHSKITPFGEVKWLRQAFESERLKLSDGKDKEGVIRACLSPEFQSAIRDAYYKDMPKVDTPYIVDKLPGNFAYLFAIKAAFPNALVIWLTRQREATIWSCFKTSFTDGHEYTHLLEDCANYYDAQETTMNHWAQFFGDRMIHVEYEQLVADPEPGLTQILARLDIPLESACLEPESSSRIVNTASRLQVREPLYRDANDAWLPYKDLVALKTAKKVEVESSPVEVLQGNADGKIDLSVD